MIFEFKLPDVGEGIAEGEIVKWFVSIEDTIEEDQPIAEIQTDKALIEITSPVNGKVKEILYEEGEIAQVNSVIISFSTSDNIGANSSSEHNQIHQEINQEKNKNEQASIISNKKKNRVIATPTVRRIARELNIDLTLVKPSGKNGRVMEEDVRRLKEQQGQMAQQDHISQKQIPATIDFINIPQTQQIPQQNEITIKRVPLRGLRRSISKKMAQSTQIAAQSTILEEIDVSQLVVLRKQMSAIAKEKGVHLTYLPFITKAVVSALKEFPYLNASLDEKTEEILLKSEYNIGIATDTSKGLTVPVIRQSDQKQLIEIAKEITTLSEKARDNSLSMNELTGGTFTITNIGSTGVGIFGTPIINYPEAAILGIHRIQKKPIVTEEEEIAVRDIMGVSLSFDHRLIDGAMASRFLKHIITFLESPNQLFMEMV
ncbi:2-oxo acid dehydrogenase subunit E2 [Cytobacillus depressus]|uniref:Dihydrolipoamide acetyltransferase component of pyruvate dehydrogenase complex n=1 Tax=Cytobacillus depressus TaxID=1602942 RepID=A0A6L3V0I3_9BACI|nr:dihydrolipoamide acetyltransferase family protein [Cytobacillus depressus]KAB2330476.1 2-oxo acid dehydrogenase subunit E2 [Cytobacillus depressus]